MKGDQIDYTERVTTNVGFNFISDYTLRARNGSTNLLLRIIPEESEESSQGVLENLKNNFEKSLGSLKDYCEKLFAEADSIHENS